MSTAKAPAADFAAACRAAGLLTEAQAAKLTAATLAKFPDAEALARQVVKLGWLSAFQAREALEGRAAGLNFGKYRLLDKLGEGGMGLVYKAQDTKLGRLVALKVVRSDYINQPNALKRFEREAKAAAALSHPHIVTLYDADETAGIRYLAMEFVAGADLAKLLKAEGKLPLPQACDYVRQAALGLAHAHAAGLVHRDVKPANLLLAHPAGSSPSLSAWGQIKVSDLGLARLHVAPDSGATKDGVMIGTIDYMAPEQARDASKVDAKADLYALGCTLHHLLAGQPPFAGETVINKMLAHQQDAAPRLRDFVPQAPEGLERLLLKLLAKEPADRPASAEAVAAALEPFCKGDPKTAATIKLPSTRRLFQQSASEQAATETYAPLEATRSQLRAPLTARSRWLLLGSGLAVCLLAILAIYNNATLRQRYASVPVFTAATAVAGSSPKVAEPMPASAASHTTSSASSTAPAVADADGWTPLWNGRDFRQWGLQVVEPPNGSFEIVKRGGEALLRLPPGVVGTLTSPTTHRNFTLRLEYQLGEKPSLGPDQPPVLKYFCIGDPADKPLGILPGFPIPLAGPKRGGVDAQAIDQHLKADLIDQKEPPPLRPAPEWNVLELRTKGAGAAHLLNGQPVLSVYNLRSRLLGNDLPLGAGKLQLLAQGQECLIRKISVRPTR